MRKQTALTFIALSLLLAASAITFGQKRLLPDTSWKLVEASGRRVSNSDAAITLDRTAASFSGSTGCNSMSGSVDVHGKNIDFGPVRTTKRACKLMAGNVGESVVLNGLADSRRYEVRNNDLRLYDRRGRTLLRFTRTHANDQDGDASRLDQRRWVLDQIKGRQTFVALPYAFINFDSKKMSAGGDNGCNSFGGGYSVKGDRITFRDLIQTMRACVEDNARMSTEREMMEGLRLANRFEIRSNKLRLYRGNEILLTFRSERK